jgi:hypothetical protein
MTIRITTIAEPARAIVKVDGRLERDDFDELVRTIEGLNVPAALDLSDLQSADRASMGLLCDLFGLGLELQSASPYIRLLLEAESARRRGRSPEAT